VPPFRIEFLVAKKPLPDRVHPFQFLKSILDRCDGDNLITMYFYLSEIKVTTGQEVKKGDIIGLVGTTGRSTGPHLFFGIRWHNARINPQFLLDDPAKIPAVIP
jgi:hypothetical protein